LKYPFVYATIYPYHIKFAGDKRNAEIDISDVVRKVSYLIKERRGKKACKAECIGIKAEK